ncbi:hypothetical protein [Virgisporangium aliadipatigenens]|nr:hypothetical protein [Virgisporangium aliadipatigenens]
MHEPFRGSDAITHGLLTRGQLAGRRWQRLLPDVYVHHEAVPDHTMWCAAALLYLPPGSAISHESATSLHGVGLQDRREPLRVTATIPAAKRVRAVDRLSIHRGDLLPGDMVRRRGLITTGPLRTAFDLGRGPDAHRAVIALDALLNRGVIRLPALEKSVPAVAGRPGVARFRRAVALAPGRAPSRRWKHRCG